MKAACCSGPAAIIQIFHAYSLEGLYRARKIPFGDEDMIGLERGDDEHRHIHLGKSIRDQCQEAYQILGQLDLER